MTNFLKKEKIKKDFIKKIKKDRDKILNMSSEYVHKLIFLF